MNSSCIKGCDFTDSNSQIKIGAALSYLQIFLNIIIGLLYTPIMIRLLGQSEYGLYNTVASTISVLSLLSLGFNAGYIRYYAKYRNEKDRELISKLNGLFLVIFSTIGIVALVCGLFLAYNLDIVFEQGLNQNELYIAKILTIVLAINLAESFIGSVFSTIISANEKFIFLKLLGMAKTVVSPIVTLPLLLMGLGSVAIVSVTTLTAIIVDLINSWYVLRVLKNNFVFRNFEKGLLGELFVYTLFIAINMIVDQINWNIDKVLLGRFKGTVAVAVYSVGYSLFSYYLMVSTSISGVFTPKIHNMVVMYGDCKDELKRKLTTLFIKVGRIQFIILTLIASGFVFFGKRFIVLWAGSGYEEAYYVALLLILPGSIALIQNIGIEMQRAQNLHHFRSIVYFFMAVINLGVSIILCQMYGAVGSALGTAMSLLIANGVIMNIYYIKKCNIDVIKFWINIIRMLKGVIGPIMIGFLWNIFIGTDKIWKMLVGISIYTIVYAISMYIFSMDSKEKNYVIQWIKSKI